MDPGFGAPSISSVTENISRPGTGPVVSSALATVLSSAPGDVGSTGRVESLHPARMNPRRTTRPENRAFGDRLRTVILASLSLVCFGDVQEPAPKHIGISLSSRE
jgi:hypothetical protein